mmetsp:Transcript_261/g.366  ORF Transcript_261/g.366 Transcript_261/m.366 type:complete len:511 (-) Transcript_261:125-1657(-)
MSTTEHHEHEHHGHAHEHHGHDHEHHGHEHDHHGHGNGHGHDHHANEQDHDGHDHKHHGHNHHAHDEPNVSFNVEKEKDDDDESNRRKNVLLRLKIASLLCLSFFLVEVIGGILSGSLAVLSDAAHLFADLAAFIVAIAASHIATLPASSTHTFGYKRMESLAALFSMACLAVVSIFLAVEAVYRMWPIISKNNSHGADGNSFGAHSALDVDGKMMSIIAGIGVVVNVILALVLGEHHTHLPGMDHGCSGHDHGHDHAHSHGHSHEHTNCDDHDENGAADTPPEIAHLLEYSRRASYDSSSSSFAPVHADESSPPKKHKSSHAQRNVNLHAAYLHVLGDLAQSVAVFIAGIVIWAKPEWQIVDPICTIIFCIFVFYSTISVMRSSISVLLEEVPPDVNYEKVKDAISALPSVMNVHDLHIWSISHGIPAMSVHATAAISDDADGGVRRALNDVNAVCQKFNITHATIQIQPRCVMSDHPHKGEYDCSEMTKKVIIEQCATCGRETAKHCR